MGNADYGKYSKYVVYGPKTESPTPPTWAPELLFH